MRFIIFLLALTGCGRMQASGHWLKYCKKCSVNQAEDICATSMKTYTSNSLEGKDFRVIKELIVSKSEYNIYKTTCKLGGNGVIMMARCRRGKVCGKAIALSETPKYYAKKVYNPVMEKCIKDFVIYKNESEIKGNYRYSTKIYGNTLVDIKRTACDMGLNEMFIMKSKTPGEIRGMLIKRGQNIKVKKDSVFLLPTVFDSSIPSIYGSFVDDALMQALGKTFNVSSQNDLNTMLDVEKRKSILGCDDQNCYAEIAGALGSRVIFKCQVIRTQRGWMFSIKGIDTQNFSVVFRKIENVIGEFKDLVGFISGMKIEVKVKERQG